MVDDRVFVSDALRLTFVLVAFCSDPLLSPKTFAGSEFGTHPLRLLVIVIRSKSVDKALLSKSTFLASAVQSYRPYQKHQSPLLVFEGTMSFG